MSVDREIPWLTDIEEAKRVSEDTGKPILMFYHYEHCAGCHKTIENTLPNMSVTDMVTGSFVPVIFEVTEQNDLVKEYGIDWTPTFVVTDSHGAETDRWVGYLPEDDYLGQLHMALARYALKKQDYKDAERRFGVVVLRFPLTELAPEAMYYHGVSRYRATGDAGNLTKAFDDLRESYPESVWTFKASAWSPDSLAKAA
jgi:thioredoxin-related protein